MNILVDFTLIKAFLEYKNVINHLMHFYIYHFSGYSKSDVEENGFYGDYPCLEDYWKEGNNRYPYIIKKTKSIPVSCC